MPDAVGVGADAVHDRRGGRAAPPYGDGKGDRCVRRSDGRGDGDRAGDDQRHDDRCRRELFSDGEGRKGRVDIQFAGIYLAKHSRGREGHGRCETRRGCHQHERGGGDRIRPHRHERQTDGRDFEGFGRHPRKGRAFESLAGAGRYGDGRACRHDVGTARCGALDRHSRRRGPRRHGYAPLCDRRRAEGGYERHQLERHRVDRNPEGRCGDGPLRRQGQCGRGARDDQARPCGQSRNRSRPTSD